MRLLVCGASLSSCRSVYWIALSLYMHHYMLQWHMLRPSDFTHSSVRRLGRANTLASYGALVREFGVYTAVILESAFSRIYTSNDRFDMIRKNTKRLMRTRRSKVTRIGRRNHLRLHSHRASDLDMHMSFVLAISHSSCDCIAF